MTLALLLVRVAETTTGHTWPAIRAHLDRLHLINPTTRPETTQVNFSRALSLAVKLKKSPAELTEADIANNAANGSFKA